MGEAPSDPCPGIRIVEISVDPGNMLILELAVPLGCPHCGRTERRWFIPVHQGSMFHRPEPGLDPGD